MKEIKRTLLLGAGGFIGKNIIDKYLEKNIKIIIFIRKQYRLERKYLSNSKITIIEGELADIELIKSIIEKYNIKIVIHLVSLLIPSSPVNMFYDEIISVIQPTYKIIDFLSQKGIIFIFFSSGGTIYGISKNNSSFKENHKLKPINYYGYSKLMIEQYIKFKHRTANLQYLTLRPSTLFGKYQRLDRKQGFIAVATKNINSGEEVDIWGDGKTIRDFIDVADVVETLFSLINNNIINESINIGSGKGYNQLEIIDIIENYLNKKALIKFKEKRFVDVSYMVLNINKLKSLIKFYPESINKRIKIFIKQIIVNEK